jgi:hypothetical protein
MLDFGFDSLEASLEDHRVCLWGSFAHAYNFTHFKSSYVLD